MWVVVTTWSRLTAKALGYEQVHSLGGGLGAWKAANLPVEKS